MMTTDADLYTIADATPPERRYHADSLPKLPTERQVEKTFHRKRWVSIIAFLVINFALTAACLGLLIQAKFQIQEHEIVIKGLSQANEISLASIGENKTGHTLNTNGTKDEPGQKGAKGEKGDACSVVLDCVDAWNSKGEKGDTCANGTDGQPGEKGKQGNKGDIGPTGSVGFKGQTGAPGPTGPTGPKGRKGELGFVKIPTTTPPITKRTLIPASSLIPASLPLQSEQN